MKEYRTLCIVSLVVIGGLTGFFTVESMTANALTPHAPILIDGNAQFTPANGVVGGSGLPANPYIIEGWDIDASSQNGLEIRNTDANFVFRNSRVSNGFSTSRHGVYLTNVANGLIENHTGTGSSVGVYIVNSRDITVSGSTFHQNSIGVRAANVDRITIADNTVSESVTAGIEAWTVGNSSLTGNSASDTRGYGITVTDAKNVTVMGNKVASSLSIGLITQSSANVTVEDNTVDSSTDGIGLWSSSDITYKNNSIGIGARNGFWLSYSERITMTRNTLASSGVRLEGYELEHWNTHSIDSTNTIDGRSIYYIKDKSDVTIPTTVGQAIVANCTKVVAQDLNVTRASGGIQIGYSSDILVRKSNSSYNEYGLHLYRTTNQTITNNTFYSNRYGVSVYGSSNATLTGNEFSRGDNGIYAQYFANATIANNTISKTRSGGVSFDYLTDSNITGNDLIGNQGCGICLWSSSKNRVSENTVLETGFRGIEATSSNNIEILLNNITGGYIGIAASYSSDITIEDNVIADTDYGTYLTASSRLTVLSNAMSSTGVFIQGSLVEHWNSHTIKTTNTVNGRPVHYLTDQSGGMAPSGAGEVILANCTGVTVEFQDVSYGTVGVLAGKSNNITIQSNTASFNRAYGIYSEGSDSVVIDNDASGNRRGIYSYGDRSTIVNNTLIGNEEHGMKIAGRDVVVASNVVTGSDVGLYLMSVRDSTVTDNIVSGSGYGLFADYLVGNAITLNIFSGNAVGVRMEGGASNIIIHNNMLHNSIQAYDDQAAANDWGTWVFIGGNYWSDYRGSDFFSEEDQDVPGSDGIGDIPYEIDLDTIDRYPLMEPTRLVDISPPSVSISSPTEGQSFTVSPITVTGFASDSGGSELSRVEVRVNGGIWQDALGTSIWSSSVDLVLGPNTIEARSWDNAYNPSAIDIVNVSLVPPSNTPPSALFIITPASGDITTVFAVDGSASSDAEDPSSALQVRWDWENDGTWDTSFTTVKTDSHQYAFPGKYVIRMEVMDTGGLVNQTTRNAWVNNTAPIASFTVIPPSGDVSTTFNFDASGSTDLEDSTSALEVRWDWNGDGFWDTGWNTVKTASHEYDEPGSFTIALEVKDTGGLTDQTTTTITLIDTPPTPMFSANPAIGDVTTVFLFDAWNSHDLEDEVTTLEVRWDWEDDGTWDTSWSTSKIALHRYPSPGMFTVRLGIRDTGGLTNSTTGQVEVVNTQPTASFTVSPESGDTSTDFVFNASSSQDLEDPVSALEVRWDWENDGTWDTSYTILKEAQHRFTSPGTWTIRLEVRDSGGLVDQVTGSVVVNSPPTAAFTVVPGTGDITTNFAFDASSSSDSEDPISALEVRWDWEDDGTWDTTWSSVKTATHRYASPGTYTIRLGVRDSAGSEDETTLQVQVINTPPIASFTASPASGDVNTIFVFDAWATSDLEDSTTLIEVRWDWESDSTWDTSWSTSKVATHQYPAPGSYDVSVEVRDSGQLTNITTRRVTVENHAPVAAFIVTPISGDPSTVFSLDASFSSDREDPTGALEFRWDWDGDGTWDTGWSSSGAAQHQYLEPGVYAIRLEVRDTDGLFDITTRTVHVASPPPAPPEFPWWISALAIFNTILVLALLTLVLLARRERGLPQKSSEDDQATAEDSPSGSKDHPDTP